MDEPAAVHAIYSELHSIGLDKPLLSAALDSLHEPARRLLRYNCLRPPPLESPTADSSHSIILPVGLTQFASFTLYSSQLTAGVAGSSSRGTPSFRPVWRHSVYVIKPLHHAQCKEIVVTPGGIEALRLRCPTLSLFKLTMPCPSLLCLLDVADIKLSSSLTSFQEEDF